MAEDDAVLAANQAFYSAFAAADAAAMEGPNIVAPAPTGPRH